MELRVLYGGIVLIRYSEDSVFNQNVECLVNAVNTVGVMGSGIALEFMLRYPEMFAHYKIKCQSGVMKTGKIDYYRDVSGTCIINFPTKWHFKYPSRLEWIEEGLKDFAATYKNNGIISVAFPKLGTGSGGLEWTVVRAVMEKHLSLLDTDIIICLDSQKNASGKEAEMLSEFNKSDLEYLSQIVKLSKKQQENLNKMMPYNRFWKIYETESIGLKTYASLFQYFYASKEKKVSDQQQISLFDIQG